MVIAGYGAMAIWCRRPLLFWIARVTDGVLDVGQAVPARAGLSFGTPRAGIPGHAQSQPAMRRRTGR